MGASAKILANCEYRALRIVVKHVQLAGEGEVDLARYAGNPYLLAEMIRMSKGHLCGYVTSPYAVENYEEVLDVHGGITYMTENADGTFTYGFDCAHAGDRIEVQNLEYVSYEAESLARQIINLSNAQES